MRGRARVRGRRRASAALSAAVGAVLLMQAAPSLALGQSLLAAEGLGLSVEPLDARSRSLGSVGVGLPGSYLLERDPAASAGIAFSTATLTFQASGTALTGGGSARQTRFPTISVSYPYSGSVFSIHLGSFLDQEFEIRSDDTLQIGGSPVDVTDQFTSRGRIGRVSLGWSRQLWEEVGLGMTFGSYVGTTERVFSRLLDSADVGLGVEPFEIGGPMRASGLVAGAGVSWDPNALVRISGAVSWSDRLVLSPVRDDAAVEGVYRIPLEFRFGGTVGLATGLALHFGTSYADWSDTGSDLRAGGAGAGAWSYGGGLEWAGISMVGRPVPLRLGVRRRSLPFDSDGASASEQLLSGGIGLNLVDADDQPLARFEIGYETGSRQAGSIDEDFSGLMVTVRVSSG